MEFRDINDNIIKNGDVINIHQTVNGQSNFVVLNVETLDIRYAFDLAYVYEYDCLQLLDSHCDIKEIEIVGNIYDYLNGLPSGYEF